ncbi:MAG: ABC transporter substrate-binding protein [Clostridia bacterium]|nr:ABC transporter substrate-binding protein [Clostridia bacterium]
MKKLILMLLALSLTLAACTSPAEKPASPQETAVTTEIEETALPPAEPIEISVLIPFGSPALAAGKLLIDESNGDNVLSADGMITYRTEVVNGADPLAAAFTSQSHDVIIAPTNMGALFYNKGIPYKYAGAVVYGNLYLASTGELNNIADLSGKEIVAFSQNSTPDVVLLTVLKLNNLSDTVNVRYVNSVSEAQGELLAGTAEVALLAEPILSVSKTKADLNIIDLQDEWTNATGAQSYPQAGIFIKSQLIDEYPDAVESILNALSESIVSVNNDPSGTASALEAIEFGLPAKIIESAIPYSHLIYRSADESKDDLIYYYEKIIELNPALLAEAIPDDDFYK